MTTLNAITSPAPALVTTVDSTGNLVIQTAGTNAVTYDANQNATHTGSISTPQTFAYKNRIINGAMMIDQRNAGSSVSNPSNNQYIVDRWQINTGPTATVGQNLNSVTPPAGFTNYLGISYGASNGAANYSFRQWIEGFNSADLAFGTANAKTITVSFWVQCSLTGTFGGAIQNGASNRSYPFSYTITSANTWQYVTVTIPGDTTGTWVGATNGYGLQLMISQGNSSGYLTTGGAWAAGDYRSVTGQTPVYATNGATFYLTGVQVELGSKATPFDYRDYGREMLMCQRYYYVLGTNTTAVPAYFYFHPIELSSVYRRARLQFPVAMRVAPTVTVTGTGTSGGYPSVDGAASVNYVALAGDVPSSGNATNYSSLLTFSAVAEL